MLLAKLVTAAVFLVASVLLTHYGTSMAIMALWGALITHTLFGGHEE